MPSTFEVGQILANGRYRIERVLGEGGMGSVYEATELTLDRKVALKVLLPELSQHPTARQRMEAEAKALARLNSPHVVRVNTVFDEAGLLVIDLEFMAGGSLVDRLGPGGVDADMAKAWISQILSGLESLHEAGLVHRDLKPGNVLLDAKGMLKVTDLGIAQDSQRSGAFKTRADANLGTPEYMSPEQIQSAATVDARADIYAAGVMLYEFLTGQVPFAGEEWEVKGAQVKQAPDLRSVSAKSPALAAVVAKALAKPAAERWQSAAEMLAGLQAPPVAVQAVVPVQAIPAQPAAVQEVRAAPAVDATTESAGESVGSPSAQGRGNRSRKVLMGLGVFFGLAAFLVLVPAFMLDRAYHRVLDSKDPQALIEFSQMSWGIWTIPSRFALWQGHYGERLIDIALAGRSLDSWGGESGFHHWGDNTCLPGGISEDVESSWLVQFIRSESVANCLSLDEKIQNYRMLSAIDMEGAVGNFASACLQGDSAQTFAFAPTKEMCLEAAEALMVRTTADRAFATARPVVDLLQNDRARICVFIQNGTHSFQPDHGGNHYKALDACRSVGGSL